MDNERLVVVAQNLIDLLRYELQFNEQEDFIGYLRNEVGLTDSELEELGEA